MRNLLCFHSASAWAVLETSLNIGDHLCKAQTDRLRRIRIR